MTADRPVADIRRRRVTSSPVEGGRPLLRGNLFGFPVHLDISFVIIMGLLGYYPGAPLQWIVLWLLITPVAVLVHELGHAFTARAAGSRPQIALAGFGGVTTFVPPRELSRARSLGISLAGPGVGLVIGVLLIVLRGALGGRLAVAGLADMALEIGIWTCIAWSVLNLLPVLPLDGGQAMRELLPGSPDVRTRRAAQVSVVTAGVAAIVAYLYFQQVFLAVFLVFFAVSNVLELRRPVGQVPEQHVPTVGVVGALWQGQPARAREIMESLAADAPPVDLAVNGAVLSLTGDPEQGHALLAQEIQRRPGDETPIAMQVLTYTLEHDWDRLIGVLQGPLGPSVPPPIIGRAVQEARGTGREDVAGRITLLAQQQP